MCTEYKSLWFVTILSCCSVSVAVMCLLALLFARLLHNWLRPPPKNGLGPHEDERALCDSERPYIGEKGPHGRERHQGRQRGPCPTVVEGLTEEKLKLFSYARMAVDIIKIICSLPL